MTQPTETTTNTHRRGMLLHVLRTAGDDCTRNGISHRHDKLTVVGIITENDDHETPREDDTETRFRDAVKEVASHSCITFTNGDYMLVTDIDATIPDGTNGIVVGFYNSDGDPLEDVDQHVADPARAAIVRSAISAYREADVIAILRRAAAVSHARTDH